MNLETFIQENPEMSAIDYLNKIKNVNYVGKIYHAGSSGDYFRKINSINEIEMNVTDLLYVKNNSEISLTKHTHNVKNYPSQYKIGETIMYDALNKEIDFYCNIFDKINLDKTIKLPGKDKYPLLSLEDFIKQNENLPIKNLIDSYNSFNGLRNDKIEIRNKQIEDILKKPVFIENHCILKFNKIEDNLIFFRKITFFKSPTFFDLKISHETMSYSELLTYNINSIKTSNSIMGMLIDLCNKK